ncbi:MAG: NUDIX domain-containing protein [Candidatus Omnitrophica bacterium]|nr:NUDIX domain-containing protein [Candidatus Omnitrophota bacterium]
MKIKNLEIEIIRSDIIRSDADAIVIPTGTRLEMDTGLAALVKKEGGAAIEEEALSKGPVKPGAAVVTSAGRLKARHIIHAVVRTPEGETPEDVLRSAVADALRRAKELKLRSLVFPALGCEQATIPEAGAARVLAQELLKCARDEQTALRAVTVCVYDEETFKVFDRTIRGYLNHLVNDLGFGPYVTVDIIIERQGGIVLIERSNPPYGWALPGGFVDCGESLEQAAAREAKEETDLELADLRQFHTYSAPGRDPRFHTVSTVFIAEGVGEPKSGDDAASLKIVQYEDLPQMDYAFDHKEIIEEYLVEKDFD